MKSLIQPLCFCALPILISEPLFAQVQVGSAASNQPSLAASVAQSIKQITEESAPSVVRVRCHDENGEIVGTGFRIDPTGTIVTLAEIVNFAQDITVEQNGKRVPATLVALDQRSGTAFLKVTNSMDSDSFLSPGEQTNISEMTPVIGIGYPREAQVTPVLGMVTGSQNREGENYLCVPHLAASVPFSEGEGGAPLLDLEGHLLGIVISGNTQSGTCTVLPSAALAQLHRNLLRYGSLNPGWVGVYIEFAAVPQQNSRTRIISVAQGSPAEIAGIRTGDMLLSLGSHSIHKPEDVLEASFYLTAGEPLEVTVSRGGVTQQLTLHSSAPPAQNGESDAGVAGVPPVSAAIGQLSTPSSTP